MSSMLIDESILRSERNPESNRRSQYGKDTKDTKTEDMNLFLVSVFVSFVIFPYCGSFFCGQREKVEPRIDNDPDERDVIPAV